MFRFTIRDVLWLTVVVALAVGWGMESRRRVAAAELAEANARETESFRVLTKFLTDKIKAHNPIRQLEIYVNGKKIESRLTWLIPPYPHQD